MTYLPHLSWNLFQVTCLPSITQISQINISIFPLSFKSSYPFLSYTQIHNPNPKQDIYQMVVLIFVNKKLKKVLDHYNVKDKVAHPYNP